MNHVLSFEQTLKEEHSDTWKTLKQRAIIRNEKNKYASCKYFRPLVHFFQGCVFYATFDMFMSNFTNETSKALPLRVLKNGLY